MEAAPESALGQSDAANAEEEQTLAEASEPEASTPHPPAEPEKSL